MVTEDRDSRTQYALSGAVGQLQASKRHAHVLSLKATLSSRHRSMQNNHTGKTSLNVYVKSLHPIDSRFGDLGCMPALPLSEGSTEQKPADVTDTGEGSSPNGAQSQPSASSSQEVNPHGVRWLDREVRSGKVAREKLVGGEGGPPPLRTDRVLRSYSMVAPRKRRKWWGIAALTVGGVASIASGTAVTGCGVGLLMACIRSGTVLTTCTATYTGTKLVVAGVDMVRKVRNQDRDPFERGTSARVWGHMLGVVGTITAAAATVPLAHFLIHAYSLLLRVSRGYADDVRFQLQSRKLLVHSADQEKVAQAVEIAERHFDTFRVESLTRNERNQVLAALGFKLPLAYTLCALTLCLPVAASKLVAPLVTTAAKRLPRAVNNACLAIERRIQRQLGPPRQAMAPFTAAAVRVAVLLVMTKPWGLMGESIASAPTLRLRCRAEGAMRVLAGTDFPEIRVPGMKPGQLQESEVSSAIPWAARYFLQ